MIDNVIRSYRDPRQRQSDTYRSGASFSYARSQPRPSIVATPRPVESVPLIQPVLTSPVPVVLPTQPVQVAAPAPVVDTVVASTPQPHHPEKPRIVPVEVDDVYTKIAALEAEAPFAPPITTPTPAAVATLVQVPVARAPRIEHQHPKRRRTLVDRLWYGGSILLVVGVLSVTGYISVDTWLTNQQVKQVVAEKQETAAQSVVLGEGEDETEVTPAAVQKYAVAADLPRMLTIGKLGINARVLPMSVNADGAMQAPVNIYDSGWYGASAKPGTPGATVIDAHASGATRHGLFAYLDTLVAGDRLSIERGDGQTFTYQVTHTEIVPLAEVDMAKLLSPYGGAIEGVNMITCTGTWIPDQKTYDHRVIVYTERV